MHEFGNKYHWQTDWANWLTTEKKQVPRGVEDLEFLRVKELISMQNFQGLIKNEAKFSRGDQEEIMWNIQGSLWFWKFPCEV